jgi:hypothetical protein
VWHEDGRRTSSAGAPEKRKKTVVRGKTKSKVELLPIELEAAGISRGALARPPF